MVSFVNTKVMGAAFEVTDRYSDLQPRGMGSSGLIWFVWSLWPACGSRLLKTHSSARDCFSNSQVAIKKIPAPFDTPALAKRTYREVHLLNHLRHDNVSSSPLDNHFPLRPETYYDQLINMTDIFISPSEDMYEAQCALRGNDLIPPMQIHCDGMHHDRSSPSFEIHIQAVGGSIYPIFYIPNAGAFNTAYPSR